MTRLHVNGEAVASGAAVRLSPEERFLRLKKELHQQLIASMDLSAIGTMNEAELRLEVRRAAEELCRQSSDLLSLSERERLVNEVLDETFGLGPLESLMRDTEISDILINGPKTVYIERRGRLSKTNVAFHDERHLLQVVHRIVARMGRRVDETTPMVDARLPDGSRLNAIIRPLAVDGALVSIRRFGARPLQVQDLISLKSITEEMLRFLTACIQARINILISGGTGSGKTTLLNALSAFIPDDERIVTIEDSAELQLQQPHVVRLETRPPNIEGRGEVVARDLVRNALRMRPDRIVIGECRGAEALDMLQAMNTGHEGSMTTIHANTPRDALMRLEAMVGMAGTNLTEAACRQFIARAIQVVVQLSRGTDGRRRLMSISEITGSEGNTITMQELFRFEQKGRGASGKVLGEFSFTGIRPRVTDRIEQRGIVAAKVLELPRRRT